MNAIHPQFVMDEQKHPVAVQIKYEEWLRIEKVLQKSRLGSAKSLEKYAGTIKLTEDPLEYQKKIRDEWQ